MRKLLHTIAILAIALLAACAEEKEHIAPAINPRDSVAVMVSYGVNTLISDSGVIKYRIVAEQWEVNQQRQPSRWIFEKGLLLENFDLAMHVLSFIQCDTAYYYDVERLWELHGRVRILTKNGLRFSSEELFWDENRHEIYSNKFSHLITPDKELQGNRFRSDEKMTKYSVRNTKGYFDRKEIDKSEEKKTKQQTDSARTQGRRPASPRRINQGN
ncbi:MAG: LPS export ABC transporter periplasmic protein LptC [Prevotella sp.]|nr:LPS export ABC transporter periplasmic protein LptC [Prevotella sp.]MBR3087938.1 LPS export ABC transporter periplasmic protein LptC [Prevotella sp.]